MMRGYTDEQMTWLERWNKTAAHWKDVTEAYNAEFGTAHSVGRLKTHCNRHGIHLTEPLGNKPSWNYKPIGHICLTANGYARVKTPDGYKMLSRLKMPQGARDLICCHFDGDKTSDMATYHSRKAMRRYALLCRYNPGFRRYRESAMIVCELDIAATEKEKKARRHNNG